MLQLPANVFFLGRQNLGSRLLVRTAYTGLLDLADELYEQGSPYFVVRGTPGTGAHTTACTLPGKAGVALTPDPSARQACVFRDAQTACCAYVCGGCCAA